MRTKTIPLQNYKRYKQLKKLVEQWTRAEVMSRSPAVAFPDYGDYFKIKLDKANEIRELLYGTSDLITIGEKLGLPVVPRNIKRKKKKRKKRHAKKADR